jgi:tyrosyl-tRNA synthetase
MSSSDLNSSYNPQPSKLSLDDKYSLSLSVGEECTEPHKLLKLLFFKTHPVCYDGFEPSGRMHIAQALIKAINVNKQMLVVFSFSGWQIGLHYSIIKWEHI